MAKNQTNATDKPGAPPENQPDASDTVSVEQFAADLDKRSKELDEREAKLNQRASELKKLEDQLSEHSARLAKTNSTKLARNKIHKLLEKLAKSGTGQAKLKIINNHFEHGGDLESLLDKLPSGTAEKLMELIDDD